MACVILNSMGISARWWTEAMNTACYIINHIQLWPLHGKTSYELWKGKKPNVGYFHVFENCCYILRDREQLGNSNSRSKKEIFLGYSTNNKAY